MIDMFSSAVKPALLKKKTNNKVFLLILLYLTEIKISFYVHPRNNKEASRKRHG